MISTITTSALMTFGQNLYVVGAPIMVSTLKACDSLNYHGVYGKTMKKLGTEYGPEYYIKFKTWDRIKRVAYINKIMEDKNYLNSQLHTILGKKVLFELTTDRARNSFFKPIYKIAMDNPTETVRLREMAKKSVALVELTYTYALATMSGNSDLIDYNLTKEDREFMNAIAESAVPNMRYIMFPGDACPDINDFICNSPEKYGIPWKQYNIVTTAVLENVYPALRKIVASVCDEEGKLKVYVNGASEVKPEEGDIQFSRPIGDYMYESPIKFVTNKEKYTSPITFIDKPNKVSEEVEKQWENKLVGDPIPEEPVANIIKEVEVIEPETEELPVEVEPEEATNIEKEAKEEVKEEIQEEPNDIESLLKDKFQDLDFEIRKEDNFTFVDVKSEDGRISSNVIDDGRYAGGKRFSVIGTAIVPNKPTLKYPQYIDINKFPDLAKKILIDEHYHLTEEERLATEVRSASPIVYEWVDFSNTEFINDLNDDDLKQLFYNCFKTIVHIDQLYSFKIEARLRIINFVDVNNFTIISDNKCTSDFAKFGLKQNTDIVEGLRIEIRSGAIMDNSTKIVNVPTPPVNPFNMNPNSPTQMFNQLNNAPASNVVMSSGFMPANDNATYLNDGTFIPNFVKPTFGTYEVPPLMQPLTNAASIIKRDMSYNEFKQFLSNPLLTPKTITDAQKLYPEYTARIIKEDIRNKSGNHF